MVNDDMLLIPSGTFLMGSPASEPERSQDETQHRVTVSRFYLGKYAVTQGEYESVMGTNPSHFKGAPLPVESVSWYDAVAYCNKRSVREGLTPAYTIDKNRNDPSNEAPVTGECPWDHDSIRWLVTWNRSANGYRLPTEAEWEYACRAGTTTAFNTGDNITTDQANYKGTNPYNGNPKGKYRETTSPAEKFPPNPWGLYNMHGNVWEWCWDWYADYPADAPTDLTGASVGSNRVYRGGAWSSFGAYLRSACRACFVPSGWYYYLGFRLARPASGA